jgi:flagellin
MLGITTGMQAKSSEKLSSGYKINRAADDAAGLSISEKMRKQMRGLDRASTNADDGVSAVQTAEGALTEVHDMLQRMNELAVKAANGTMSSSDKADVQNEIAQLSTEIDRVSTTTKFNETYLLNGNKGGKSTVEWNGSLSFALQVGADNLSSNRISVNIFSITASAIGVGVNDKLTADQKKLVSADVLKKLTDAEAALAQEKAKEAAAQSIQTKTTKVKTAKNNKGKKVKVGFAKVEGANGYQVRYSLKKSMKSSKSKVVTGTSATLTKLKKKTYYIQVRAFSEYNGTKYYTKWSAKKKVKVKK